MPIGYRTLQYTYNIYIAINTNNKSTMPNNAEIGTPSTKFRKVFMTQSFLFTNKEFFTTHIVFLFKKQKIRIINLWMSKMKVNQYTSNHGRECHTTCTLEMHCGLIPQCGSNIVNPSIPSKPSLCVRFGWTMMKYIFYLTISQSGVKWKGDKNAYAKTGRQMNLIGQTCRHTGIETTHPIG